MIPAGTFLFFIFHSECPWKNMVYIQQQAKPGAVARISFRRPFSNIGLTFVESHMHHVKLNLRQPLPQGAFYNRMSASSHTHGHRSATEYTLAVLRWLKSYRRKVINGELSHV